VLIEISKRRIAKHKKKNTHDNSDSDSESENTLENRSMTEQDLDINIENLISLTSNSNNEFIQMYNYVLKKIADPKNRINFKQTDAGNADILSKLKTNEISMFELKEFVSSLNNNVVESERKFIKKGFVAEGPDKENVAKTNH
jgi:hypothetical protein